MALRDTRGLASPGERDALVITGGLLLRHGHLLAALLGIVAFALYFCRDLTLPGLYFDSINPEYLAVRIIGDGALPGTPAFALPGNLIGTRFPVLAGSYYHGPLQFYLALPMYAMLGTNIVSARIVQGLYGVLILLAMGLVAKRYPVRLPVAGALLLLLAIDPTYNILFKTQAYNVVWPLVWLLLAIAMIERWSAAGAVPKRRQLFAAGAMLGIAFFCYFVFLLFVPAMTWYLVVCLRRVGVTSPRRIIAAVACSAGGFLLGCIPYALGYVLAYHATVDANAFWSGTGSNLDKLLVNHSQGGWLQEVSVLPRAMFNALGDLWVSRLVLRSPDPWPLGVAKVALLLTAPLILHLLLRLRDSRSRLLELCIALVASYFAATLLFGTKISGHHYTVLLPLLYLGIAAGLSDAWPLYARQGAQRVHATCLTGTLALLLAGYDLVTLSRFGDHLRATGGVGYFSDAINRYSENAGKASAPAGTRHYFPEWGLMLPFVFLTGGDAVVKDGSPAASDVLAATCSGHGVRIAMWTRRAARRLARDLARAEPSLAPRFESWSQRDGMPAFYVVTYDAGRPDTFAPNAPCLAMTSGSSGSTQGIEAP